jgi:hypothetical protein
MTIVAIVKSLAIVLCLVGALTDCFDSADYGKTASFVVPQSLFTDGLHRYNDLIQQGLAEIEAAVVPDKPIDYGRCKKGYLSFSHMTKKFTITDLQVQVGPSATNAIIITFNSHVSGSFPSSVNLGFDLNLLFTHVCISIYGCSGTTTFDGDINFSIVLELDVDPSTCLLTIKSRPTAIFPHPISYTGCGFSGSGEVAQWIASLFGFDIQNLINAFIVETAQNIIDKLIGAQFALPAETALANNIFIAYEVESVNVTQGAAIVVAANTRVRTIDPVTNKSISYVDPMPQRQATRPPVTFELHQPPYYITSEARVSDEVLHGLLWAYQLRGFRTASGNVTVLDANITIMLKWNNLDFSIGQDGMMVMGVDFGTVYGYCNTNTLLEIGFFNLSGSATLLSVVNETTKETGVYMQVLEWYQDSFNLTLVLPQVMLPTSVINDFARSALSSSINQVNSVLSSNVLWLPSSIAPYAPNAHIELINQPTCCNGTHGYFQISIKCSCGPDPLWPSCSGLPCESAALLSPARTNGRALDQPHVLAHTPSLALATQEHLAAVIKGV